MELCEGGWSNFLRVYLRQQLIGPLGIATSGVPLLLNGAHVLLFANLTNILSDGDGIRIAFDWKGQGALKPCFKHYNVFKKDSDLASRRAGYCEITCADPSRFKLWKRRDLATSVDLLGMAATRVTALAMTKVEFEELQKTTGLNHNKHGLTADVELRAYVDPVACCTWDWVHNMLQDGTFTTEVAFTITHMYITYVCIYTHI